MDINSLSYKTLKNVSYTIVSYGWGMIFAIFVTPVVVFKLGIDYYGVFIFVNTIAGLLGLIDFGVSTAVAKYIAEYYGSADRDRLKQLLYSANSLFLLIGLFGLIGFFIIAFVGRYFIPNTILSTYDIFFIFISAGLIFFINSINGIYSITPTALQRFDINTKIGVSQTFISSLGILLIVVFGFKLKAIIFAQLVIAIVFTFIFRYHSQKLLDIVKLKLQWHPKEIIKCYKFGLLTSISNLGGQTLAYFDKLIIPIFMNPASLSYYSLSDSVASKSTGLISSITYILFPMVSNFKGSKDMENIKKLYIRSFGLATVLSAAISLSIIFLAYKVMYFWLNEEVAINAYRILIVLAITYFFISLWIQLKNFLLGLGETKILAKFSIIIAIFNIILLFILLPKFGIMGAAISYLISIIPVIYIFFIVEKNILKLENRFMYYIKLYSKILITGFVFYFIINFLVDPLILNFPTLLVCGPLAVLIYLVLYRIFGFYEAEDLFAAKNFYFVLINKFKK